MHHHPGMPPGLFYWWANARRRERCGDDGPVHEYAGWPGRHGRGRDRDERSSPWDGWQAGGWGHHHHEDGGGFGVRRPLRFLAHKLDLSEAQVTDLANILNDLKTERAQAEVDERRTMAAFADAVAGGSFDEGRAKEGADLRTQSTERLRDAVTKALGRIHALLDEEQRKRFAYLIRTGVLAL
ncbi:Spy/CpxP family protein refolding chaperone [Pendulispora rubella]|uniref:Spy/CpxP family protein refolding chaperone n=1 Tax=Pendulispora rubella TaxID=2741070 RepID=A0ABZ2LDW8_9BACT